MKTLTESQWKAIPEEQKVRGYDGILRMISTEREKPEIVTVQIVSDFDDPPFAPALVLSELNDDKIPTGKYTVHLPEESQRILKRFNSYQPMSEMDARFRKRIRSAINLHSELVKALREIDSTTQDQLNYRQITYRVQKVAQEALGKVIEAENK